MNVVLHLVPETWGDGPFGGSSDTEWPRDPELIRLHAPDDSSDSVLVSIALLDEVHSSAIPPAP